MIAIFSDIHGNLEALEAVLAIEYDVDRTVQKIRRDDDEDFHGRRLPEGR